MGKPPRWLRISAAYCLRHAIARGDLRDAEIAIRRDRQPDLIVEASQKTLTPMLAVDAHLPTDDEAISGEWLASINALAEVALHEKSCQS